MELVKYAALKVAEKSHAPSMTFMCLSVSHS